MSDERAVVAGLDDHLALARNDAAVALFGVSAGQRDPHDLGEVGFDAVDEAALRPDPHQTAD